MDPIDTAKSYARLLREHPYPSVDLSHGQALEIVVVLMSKLQSWNEFAAHPCALKPPDSVTEYVAAVCHARRRLLQLCAPQILTTFLRSSAAIAYLHTLVRSYNPSTLLWNLLDTAGVPSLGTFWNGRGGYMPPEPGRPDSDLLLTARMRHWLLYRRQGDRAPWLATERLAISLGFSRQEATTIREIQNQALSKDFPITVLFAVGLFDSDMTEFLRELKPQQHLSQYFRELLSVDELPT